MKTTHVRNSSQHKTAFSKFFLQVSKLASSLAKGFRATPLPINPKPLASEDGELVGGSMYAHKLILLVYVSMFTVPE